MNDHRLWYDAPAEDWQSAFPLGNGRLGAMVFGRPLRREDYYSERIVLNEDSVWYGGPRSRINPAAREHLPRVRQLLLEGRVAEAEYLADMALTAMPRNQHPYQPLAELVLTGAADETDVTDYRRELDLDAGAVAVRYRAHGILRERQMFCSAVDGVFAMRLSAGALNPLQFHAYLRRRPFDGEVAPMGSGGVGIRGQAGPGGVRYAAGLRIVAEGGTVGLLGQCVRVEGAASAVLLVAGATDYRGDDPWLTCAAILERAAGRPFDTLLSAHQEDHRRLYRRVSFRLGAPDRGLPPEDVPTDVRLARVKAGGGAEAGLMELLFQYGRYLLIACSRPGSLPANLQGLWNDSMTPIWNSNYTTNINLQMNYWPAEVCNLGECHLPLIEFLKKVQDNGRRTAAEMYGCRGFVAHHALDLWADTAPSFGVHGAALWPLGGAWLALHAWEHYRFTLDREFLAGTAYPLLKDAALFFLDFLVPDRQGRLVTALSVSPEHHYRPPDGPAAKLAVAPAMDSQILRELFGAVIEAAERLGVDAPYREELRQALGRLPAPVVDDGGRLAEWLEPHQATEPGHRHLSHLFAVYPGSQIDAASGGPWAEAARRSIAHRLEDESRQTEWSRAWIVNLAARLGDGELAHGQLVRLLQRHVQPNLLGSYPPFQIDGNFGAAAGVAEMLVQSHDGRIRLLPALPEAWPDGAVRGLRARGGFEVAIEWRDGALAAAELCHARGGTAVVVYRGRQAEVRVKGGETVQLDGDLKRVGSPVEAGAAAADQQAALGGKGARTKPHTTHPEAQWFPAAGLGLFVHWGIASVHGDLDLSWAMMANTVYDGAAGGRNKLPPEDYWALAERFRPERYDPDRWLAAAARAGMQYAVLTAMHHDGYTLWPTAHGELGVQSHLGGRDLVGPFVEACRRHGLKVGLYYSPADWYAEREFMSFNYGSGNPQRFPGRPHFNTRHQPCELPPRPEALLRRWRAVWLARVEELLTRYGRIDLLWFDGGAHDNGIRDRALALQPHLVINSRSCDGDFDCTECTLPKERFSGWFETPHCWQASDIEAPWGGKVDFWGYLKAEQYKSTAWMLSMLAPLRAWGGNLLINVGPRPDGELPEVVYRRLEETAAWMAHSRDSVVGAGPGPRSDACTVPVTTRDDGRIWYLHFLPGGADEAQIAAGRCLRGARLLRTGEAPAVSPLADGGWRIGLAPEQRSGLDDVVAVEWA